MGIPMKRITVAFADDHPLVLKGIAAVFGRKADYAIVGMALSIDDALLIVERAKPDVVCLDLGMRGDTIAGIRRICQCWPGTKVMIFTASESIEHAVKALNAGARGYVLKGSTSEELATSLKAVAQSEVYITPSLAAKVIMALQLSQSRAAESWNPIAQLSVREVQVIKLLQEGKRNCEIATALHLSEKTIKCYMTTLMQKLNARSRLEVVVALKQRADQSPSRSVI